MWYRVSILILALVALPGLLQATSEENLFIRENDNPAWAPNGQHIAFDMRENEEVKVWLIHPDGSGLEQVVSGFDPEWSPDAAALYFKIKQDGSHHLRRRVMATSVESQVSSGVGEYAVSHSGQELILDVVRGDETALIIASAATGADIRWLASKGYTPSWSPDDTQAVFGLGGNLWVRNTSDRSGLRQVTFLSTDVAFSTSDADWSSTGFIAFTYEGDIYKVRPDGTDLTLLFQEPSQETLSFSPRWSPDGTKLVFVRLPEDSQNLWLINADGTGLTQLTHTVAEASFSPTGGTYNTSQNVTITSATSGATIRYTTDGTDPTESSTLYSSPVAVNQTTTLKAKAWKTDFFPSTASEAAYSLKATTPAFDPNGGTYSGTQNVTITCATSGVVIRYTTDGSEPTESSTEYTDPVVVSTNLTLKAKAFKTGWEDSDIAAAEYVIQ